MIWLCSIGGRGNLFVQFSVNFPDNVSATEEEVAALGKLLGQTKASPSGGGIFGYFKTKKATKSVQARRATRNEIAQL